MEKKKNLGTPTCRIETAPGGRLSGDVPVFRRRDGKELREKIEQGTACQKRAESVLLDSSKNGNREALPRVEKKN